MAQYVLTHDEASLLSAFSEDEDSTLPELAVATRLAPSRVRSVVADLTEKQLLAVNGTAGVLRLTTNGVAARHVLEHGQVARPHQPVDVFILGSERPAWRETVDTMGLRELDSAIDAELSRLQG